MTDRFTRREGDGWLVTAIHLLIAWVKREAKAKAVLMVGAFSAFLGSLLMWLVMRLMVVDKVMAQDTEHTGRMVAIETEAALLEARVDSVEQRMKATEGNTGMLIRVECLRTSLADQALLQMTCPANLYRGAPR